MLYMKKRATKASLCLLCVLAFNLAGAQAETQNTNLPYWRTSGNSGTSPAGNFIGTTDAQPFIVKTNGAAAANERLRFLTTPQIVINSTTAQSGDLFAVYGTSAAGALNSVAGQTDFPINAYSAGGNAGVFAENVGSGQGVLGANTSTGVGVYGITNNASSIAVFGYNQAAGIALGATSTGGNAISGITSGTLVTAVRGLNQNATGTGIIGLGNNITAGTVLANGSGIAANGTAAGIFSIGTNAATGIGVMAGGSNVSGINNTGAGEGVAANGLHYGVSGYAVASGAGNNDWGGYFDNTATANGYAYVAGRTGGVDYAILSGGTKSTMVKDDNGQNRIMFCTEAPEVLFQDFGTGKLVKGRAHINVDPLFAKNISKGNTVKVFVQLEGNCAGVYVTNKSNTGFDVIELNNGKSDVTFSWQIVGNRANTFDRQGNLANAFADVRFPVGPGKVKSVVSQSATTTTVEMKPAMPLKGGK